MCRKIGYNYTSKRFGTTQPTCRSNLRLAFCMKSIVLQILVAILADVKEVSIEIALGIFHLKTGNLHFCLKLFAHESKLFWIILKFSSCPPYFSFLHPFNCWTLVSVSSFFSLPFSNLISTCLFLLTRAKSVQGVTRYSFIHSLQVTRWEIPSRGSRWSPMNWKALVVFYAGTKKPSVWACLIDEGKSNQAQLGIDKLISPGKGNIAPQMSTL